MSLEEVVEREGLSIPLLVEASIQYLETKVETEGLMRLAGAAGEKSATTFPLVCSLTIRPRPLESIRIMRKRFEAGKKVEIATMNDYGPHAVARYVRLIELPG